MIETKREAYIRRIENALKTDDTEITHEIVFTEEAAREILELLEEKPERKTGKWIDYTEDGYVECPFCHSATNCDGNKEELHFCFSCGADMRGE